MESIDDLLAEVKAEYQEPAPPRELKKQQPLNGGEFFSQPTVAPTHQPQTRHKNITYSPGENLLAQLKAEFEEQGRTEQIKREQEIREEKLREEQRKQQQRKALRSKAEEWLKNVNPRSAEGLWFEEFAYSYPSRLEAAIDYLQALQETKP